MTAGHSAKRLEGVRRYFDQFARVEAPAQGSSIYARLSEVVRDDPALVALAAESGSGQPPANLLFAAVHYLLLADPSHALAAYYPSAGGTTPVDAGLDRAFRDFVAARREDLLPLLHTRLVQTNEVRRCTALLPAFRTASDEAGAAPLALIEVGPSAGLNLLFDRYAYDYSGLAAGDPSSALTLRTEVRGAAPPVDRVPGVVLRHGIDLNALDVRSDEDVRWLQALIWPEHDERRRILASAIQVAREDPPDLVSGDIFRDLPTAIEGAPADAAVVVFATFVLNQFTPEMLARLRTLLVEASRVRPVRVVTMGANEWFGAWRSGDGTVETWLATVEDGHASARRLLRGDPHGWWLTWDPGEPRDWAEQ